MSDVFWFEKCPKCGRQVIDQQLGTPELSGYPGDITECSECKAKFMLMMRLQEIDKIKGGEKR